MKTKELIEIIKTIENEYKKEQGKIPTIYEIKQHFDTLVFVLCDHFEEKDKSMRSAKITKYAVVETEYEEGVDMVDRSIRLLDEDNYEYFYGDIF